jgi:uncharacterized membrane protein YbhN (UPF0104 family)
MRHLGVRGSIAVLGLSLLNYALRFERWQYYLRILGRNLPAGRHLLYYLSGFAFTVSPAKAGEAVRSLYLRDYGVTYAESVASLFTERLQDLFSIVALASMMILNHAQYRPLLIASVGSLTVVFLIIAAGALPPMIDFLAGHLNERIANPLRGVAGLLRSSRRLMRPKPLLLGFVLGLFAWTAEGVGFGFICEGLQIGGGMPAFIGIYALAVLAGSAAFFLPAGIGGTEVVMTALLVELGAPLGAAITATLLCRLATLWFAVIIGVLAASVAETTHRITPVRAAP